MNKVDWDTTIAELEALDDRSVAAAARIHAEAILEDVPRLMSLLETADNIFVREAAAWPLAELVGAQVLPALLRAYQRGFDEGQDNDGFSAALLEIPALHPGAARSALLEISLGSDEPMRGHAKWLLDFCEDSHA
ncbi:MAG: hypothetical protein WBK51_10865 [Polaromonas sp.]